MLARLPAVLISLSLVLTAGCKENGNDYLREGLRLLGEAERGDCQPDVENGQAIIDADRVAMCLNKTKAGLEQLHKAHELGIDNKEINDLIAKTEDEVRRLESMLKLVTRMQHER